MAIFHIRRPALPPPIGERRRPRPVTFCQQTPTFFDIRCNWEAKPYFGVLTNEEMTPCPDCISVRGWATFTDSLTKGNDEKDPAN